MHHLTPPRPAARGLRRRSAATLAVSALALALTACGGSDGSDGADDPTAPSGSASSSSSAAGDAPAPTGAPVAAGDTPTDASVADFCAAIKASPAQLDADDAVAADQIHEYAATLAAAGTPDGFSAAGRAGFEVLVTFFAGVDPGDIEAFKAAGTPEKVLGAEDGASAEAFFTEAVTVCQPELATESPVPSDGAS